MTHSVWMLQPELGAAHHVGAECEDALGTTTRQSFRGQSPGSHAAATDWVKRESKDAGFQ